VSRPTDIGPGTYTVVTIVASEYLGLGPTKVELELGNSFYPMFPGHP
jgi:xanthine dehydrogenase YagR molybdenum-binding subunit